MYLRFKIHYLNDLPRVRYPPKFPSLELVNYLTTRLVRRLCGLNPLRLRYFFARRFHLHQHLLPYRETFYPTVLSFPEATMATNEQTLDQSPPLVEAGLDEDSVISSLARLQELHISVCHSLTLKTNKV